jgi:hypothetical protein
MPHQSRIRPRPACGAALVALAMLAVSEFAGAQGAPAIPQTPATEYSISLLPPEQMTADDQAVALRQQPAIAESAQFYGYILDSSYTYRQMGCPVAPNHLLLAYEATSPNGSISRFTAVVRRGSQSESGRQIPPQIIPILHFGIVPFIPAIANPHSIEVFNSSVSPAPSATEVLSATRTGSQPLLVRALCYLAMVGEEPAALRSPSSDQATIHAPIPTLVFRNQGKIRQLISIRSSAGAYQVWALTFQAGGKLLTATRAEHPIDRTPLVLNAANSGSPSVSTGTTAVPSSAAPISSAPMTPKPSPPPPAAITAVVAPTAPAEPIAPGVEPSAAPTPATAAAAATPTPPAPAANPPAEVPTPAAPTATAAKVEVSPLAAPPPPAEVTAPVTHPATTPVSAPAAASTVEPVAPATPAAASVSSPQPLSVPTTVKPEPAAAATLTPQPPSPPSAPAATAAASAAIAPPPPPAVVSVATPLVVKPSPPLPLGRFIPNPPQPPSRFIPDSALKNPPHLPQ